MNTDFDGKQPPNLTHERHVWQSRFLTRFGRYKTLLATRWWILVTTLTLGVVLQASLWQFQAPVYVSSGRMIVNLKLSIPEGSLYSEELNNFLGTQAALMQSAAVINRAQEQVAIQLADPEPQNVSLKAVILPRTTIFLLQGTGRDARYTQGFVQACMEAYISLKKEMRAQTSDTTLAGITEEVVRLEKELRKSDEELIAFSSTNSVVLLQEQGNHAGNLLAGLNQRLATLKSEFALLQILNLDQNLERQQQTGLRPAMLRDTTDSSARLETLGLSDSDYLRARQQVLLLKTEQDDLANYLRAKHPRMVALTEEIGRRERLLAIFRQQSAQQLEAHKESVKLQILNLEQEAREWESRVFELSRRSAEFQRLKANAQRTQALYDRLLATMQTLDVNKQISPESVTVMEKASPAVTDRPGLTRKLVFGALAGLSVGMLILMVLDRLNDRIGCLSELQELFNEEILGQIPREKSALREGFPGLLQMSDERYSFVEAYRNLRSSLLYISGANQRPRTLLVTSSVPNDGKSLTSANLAITLASAGARVLLVDADLRKGSLHNRFGFGSGMPGLTEALTERAGSSVPSDELLVPATSVLKQSPRAIAPSDSASPASSGASSPGWASSVLSTKIPNLSLLPRGQPTHRSSELFLGPLAVQFLEEAAGRYDFVILDTAPVMAADDVTSLAPHVDGVIFVVRAEHSSARVARAALDLLYLRHVRVLGLVFNAVRPSSADYYYYYKYKDYYGSYPAA